MSRFSFYAAMAAAKASQAVLDVAKKNARWYLPARIAWKFMPDFPGNYLQMPKTVIVVTGTDGKTSVCNLLYNALTAMGKTVVCNRTGYNTLDGVQSAAISASSWTGKARADVGIFEIDERRTKKMCALLHPDYLLVTALFRDSINNNAHPEYIAQLISDGVPADTHLILNADDVLSACLAPQVPPERRTYYGLCRLPGDYDACPDLVNDARVCPHCLHPLTYETVKYHHIGRVRCAFCGFCSPEPDVLVSEVDEAGNSLILTQKGERARYPMVNNSVFNIYNEAGAIALLREMGCGQEETARALATIRIVNTRYSSEDVGSCKIITHLAKGENPVACSRCFDYVRHEPGDKEIILILDDMFERKSGSEDTAWIFDSDFEFLNDPHIKRIVIGGVRRYDYAVRMKMADIPPEKWTIAETEMDTVNGLTFGEAHVDYYILHDLWLAKTAFALRDQIRARVLEAEKKVECTT